MVYDHMVKINGKYYQAGVNVPDATEARIEKTEIPEPEYSDKDIEFENNSVSKRDYTKTDINKMNVAELQELASENGVDNAYDMTGSALKQVLIDKFGL